MNQSGEERLQQLLCAYVLNEVTDAERQEVEAALAGSEELRAEKARFESTIALVAGAYEGEEKLSEASMAELSLAASNRGGRVLQGPWYGKASVRVAAAIVFVVGAFGMVKLLEKDTETKRDDLVAKVAFELSREASEAPAERGASSDDMLGVPRVRIVSEDKDALDLSSFGVPLNEDRAADIDVKTAQGSAIASPQVESERNRESRELTSTEFARGLPGQPVPARELGLQGNAPDQEEHGDFVGLLTVTEPVAQADPFDRALPQAVTGGAAVPRLASEFLSGENNTEAKSKDAKGVPTRKATKPSGPAGPSAGGPSTPGALKKSRPAATVPVTTGASGRLVLEAPPEELAEALEGLGYASGEEVLFDEEPEEVEFELGGSDDFFLGHGEVDGEDDARMRRRYKDEDRIRIPLTADEITQTTELKCGLIFNSCRQRPNESPRDMFFRYYGDNPFVMADLDKLSTFAADVDTSSYVLVRNYLKNRHLPTKAQVRTEEFVNYFRPDVEAPTEGVFNIVSELAPSRFSAQPGRWMLRVAVRGREVSREERKPLNLTFVTDTSGSMKEQNRMELVKHALRLLVTQLDARDSIAIVGFSTEATVVLPMTSAANRGVIESAIYSLQPDGGTNPEAGLVAGYEIAARALSLNSHNRVVLLSDGVGNIGETDQNRLTDKVKAQRELGIYLNTIGVGMNNHNDEFLEQLANKGDGLSNYIDDELEARRALVENFTGAFEPIARDVKIQVEFDPSQVYRYRQLGYENRAIADADFRNDKVDAGEIGAGHQVVCLYEIELDPSYNGDSQAPLATVRLRYKQPTGAGRHPLEDSATEITHSVRGGGTSFEGTSAGFRRSVIAAQFAEILRRSEHARGDSITDVIAAAAKLAPEIRDADFQEMLDLMSICRGEILKRNQRRSDLDDSIRNLRRHNLRAAQYEVLGSEVDQVTAEDLAKLGADLEESIRRIIRRRIEAEQREVPKVR